MASTASNTISVLNETEHTSSRITVEGRKITYKLRVIQRPERARACGQGAKSSSDRRPVDPPPIVDLQVLEGDEQRDITFTYNANFFLFATLEEARQKAQGRVPVLNSNQPVLTGTPVAGMAYLDRPAPAGYFIFPDLSVRHEGHFRLSFTLFEETKDAKDADNDATPSEMGPSVHGRCEVKSLPFHVYSAKKFPGLTESTPLSRTVADQGCRVRIRRDVRMRRRTDKPQKDWDDGEEEETSRQSPTPEVFSRQPLPVTPGERQRSVSNTSNISYQPLHQAPRRGSAQDLHSQYNRPYQAQVELSQPQASIASLSHDQPQLSHPSHLQSSQQQAHVIPSSYHQTHIAQFSPSYPSHFPPHSDFHSYHAPQYNYAQAPAGQQPQTTSYAHMPHPMYDPQAAHIRQQSLEYGPGSFSYPRDMTQQTLSAATPMPPPDSTSLSSGAALPPLQRLNPTKPDGAHERAVAPPDFGLMGPRPLGNSAKRPFDSTFGMQHVNEPLRGGARPDPAVEAAQEASDGSDDDAEMQMLRMNYRRADGSKVSRAWPQSAI